MHSKRLSLHQDAFGRHRTGRLLVTDLLQVTENGAISILKGMFSILSTNEVCETWLHDRCRNQPMSEIRIPRVSSLSQPWRDDASEQRQ